MRTRLTYTVVVYVLLGVIAGFGYAAQGLSTKKPEGVVALTPYPAPPLIVIDDQGKKHDLTAARGQWAFVHFWAAWCVPCKREMPHVGRLMQQMRDKPMQFFIVNTADSEDAIFEFLGGLSVDIASFRDPDGQYTELWKPRGLPSTFLVDPQGQVRLRALGGREWGAAPYVEFLNQLIQ